MGGSRFAAVALVVLLVAASSAALQAHGSDLSPLVRLPSNDACAYSFTVRTGDRSGAGTDSVITIRLFDSEDIQYAKVYVNAGGSRFERGSTDHFTIRGLACGRVCALRVTIDGSGFFPHWYCDSVQVTVSGSVPDYRPVRLAYKP